MISAATVRELERREEDQRPPNPERSIRVNNDQAYLDAVGGYEALWETQSMQRLVIFYIAPSGRHGVSRFMG